MNKPGSYVYFAKCLTIDGADMNAIKVGLSSDLPTRIAALASNQPYFCELISAVPGDMFLEHFTHMWLREFNISGEYFRAVKEVVDLAHFARDKGKLPFPVKFVSKNDWSFRESIDCVSYMERKGISFADIGECVGIETAHYKKLLEREPWGNRRFLAALSVTAVKKGHSVVWVRDFKPSPVDVRKAA